MFNISFGYFFCYNLVLFLCHSCNKILLNCYLAFVMLLFLFFFVSWYRFGIRPTLVILVLVLGISKTWLFLCPWHWAGCNNYFTYKRITNFWNISLNEYWCGWIRTMVFDDSNMNVTFVVVDNTLQVI
jgi:hypothetical protein